MPDGTKLGQGEAAGDRLRRDDPRRLRARARAARASAAPGSWCSTSMTPDAEFAAGHAARGGAADRRPRCSSSRSRRTGPTASASTASRASCTPRPARRSRRRPWARGPRLRRATLGGARVEVRCPDLCPRFTARVFENVTIAPSPLWLKARLTAAGQRPINNVVDITNYVMLADRPAAARLRPRPRRGRAADRAPRRRGRAGRDARRADAHARRRDGRDRGRAGPDLDRRDHGRRALGGASRTTTPRAARGRHLERPQHPPHLVGARPAQRGLGALREGAPARAAHARAGGRERADGRAVRRDAAARARSTSAASRAGPAADRAARARASRRSSACRSRASARPRSSARSTSRPSRSADGLDRRPCRRCAATTSRARST